MRGRREMHGRQQIAVAIVGRMGERAWKALLLFYIYSYLYGQLVRVCAGDGSVKSCGKGRSWGGG